MPVYQLVLTETVCLKQFPLNTNVHKVVSILIQTLHTPLINQTPSFHIYNHGTHIPKGKHCSLISKTLQAISHFLPKFLHLTHAFLYLFVSLGDMHKPYAYFTVPIFPLIHTILKLYHSLPSTPAHTQGEANSAHPSFLLPFFTPALTTPPSMPSHNPFPSCLAANILACI